MSGFDNGTLQGGVYFQAKQFGSILRGFGPPVPQAGVIGDLYIDTLTFELYNKRSTDASADVDPWGHYLFVVPALYQARLKWFSAYAPPASVGIDGDYCLLWGGYPNYGIQPMIYGPKAAGAWPVNPVSVPVTVNPLYTAEDVNQVNSSIVTTALNYVVKPTDSTVVFNAASSAFITLPDATQSNGRVIRVKAVTNFNVVSSANNVVPLAGGAAQNIILGAATAGKWADLQSDGTAWNITAAN